MRTAGICLIAVLFRVWMPAPGAAAVKDFQARGLKYGTNKTLPYRLFVPKNYQASKKYPLMLTLHGAGERGSDDSAQLKLDFSRMWAADSIQTAHPCFVVAPQCPNGSQWVNTPWAKGSYAFDSIAISEPMAAVVGLLDSLAKEFNLDPDRIYVSGLSMGGFGTWYLAMKFPTRFAAIVPVCGGADPKKASTISAIPIWTFHAEDDATVPVTGTREMVAALKAVGSKVIYTEYPKALKYNHASWVPAAKTPGLPAWVFQQARATAALRPSEGGIPDPGAIRAGIGVSSQGRAGMDGSGARVDAAGKRRSRQILSGPGFALPSP